MVFGFRFRSRQRERVAGQEGNQVLRHSDGPHAGAAAAVRNAKRLVQVEVADVGAERSGIGQTHESVKVGAIHINLAAVSMHDGGDLLDAALEHAVGGRVGDHERGKVRRMLRRLGAKVGEIDVPLGVAGHGHDREASHRGARGIGAVRGGGDQADLAAALAARLVPPADGEQARVFAVGAGVGLKRNGRETGDFREPGLQIGEEFLVAAGLPGRGEWMEVAELRPGDGKHLAGGVELHRAGA